MVYEQEEVEHRLVRNKSLREGFEKGKLKIGSKSESKE